MRFFSMDDTKERKKSNIVIYLLVIVLSIVAIASITFLYKLLSIVFSYGVDNWKIVLGLILLFFILKRIFRRKK